MNVYDLKFSRDDLSFINDKQAHQLDYVELKSGDVLINITGASVARCCDLPNDLAGGRVNQHVTILRPNPTVVNGRYLSRVLVSPGCKDRLLSIGKAGATREALPKYLLESFEIELPPLDVQRRIAGILSAYDDLIEVNTRRIAILEEMARRLFDEWFVQFRFPGAETRPLAAEPVRANPNPVAPAKAGVQGNRSSPALGSRFCGNDDLICPNNSPRVASPRVVPPGWR